MPRPPLALLSVAALLLSAACAKNAASPTDAAGMLATTAPALLSLSPVSGMTGVDPMKPIVLTFNMGMMTGTDMLVVVHEGSVTGAQIAGTSTWSSDRRTMTFTPTTALKPKTTYVVHLSPSMIGTNGKAIDLGSCAKIGGQTVTGGMMGSTGNGMMGSSSGGMVNGSWGPGMMGAGWQATDGTFGMVFSFTTA